MIGTLAVFAVLAAGSGLLLHRDMCRADERRRRRGTSLAVAIELDVTEFVAAMARAAQAANSAAQSTAKLRRAIDELPCRWCRVLAAVGLSHHAAHYRPRHRAAAR